MNNLKALLKKLEEKKEKLISRQSFTLYYDTVELEFVKHWRDNKSVYKEEELTIVNDLIDSLNLLTSEANSLLAEIETFQRISAVRSEEPQESSINDFIGKINGVTRRIETISADCDDIIRKLPGELAVGTP